jgi:hypothetical protein
VKGLDDLRGCKSLYVSHHFFAFNSTLIEGKNILIFENALTDAQKKMCIIVFGMNFY